MQTKDLTAGTDYALSVRCGTDARWWTRVTMVEPGRGSSTVADHDLTGRERTVQNAALVATWAEREQIVAEAAHAEIRHRQAMRDIADRRNADHARLTALVPDAALPWWARSNAAPAEVRIDYRGVHGLDSGGRFGSSLDVTDLLRVATAAIARATTPTTQEG